MENDRLKRYVGKRTSIEVRGAPGISRNMVWSQKKQSYTPPRRGMLYTAHRTVAIDGSKKREARNFNSIDEARTWQADRNALRDNGTLSSYNSPKLKVVISAWENSWNNLAENTKIQYRKGIPFYKSICDLPIENIKAADIDALIAEWLNKKEGYRSYRSSFIKELQTLTYIYSWYQNNFDEATTYMPFKQRHWNKAVIKKKSAKRKYMTSEETDRFLSELKTISWMFFVLAYTQLKQIMRISETAAMDRSRFRKSEKTYLLNTHVVWPRIGGSEPYLEAGTKTLDTDDEHIVHLYDDVAEMLDKLPRHPATNLFFHNDGQLLTYRQIQYAFDSAFKKAGLPFRGTHVLRHTGSTQFYNDTNDLLALQHMGAWKNGRMPEHYAKVLGSKAKAAIDKIQRKSNLRLVKGGE